MAIADLPAVNATLNAIATTLLLAGFVAIKRGHEAGHKKLMLSAVGTSALFLISYLTYHANTQAVTRFPEEYPTARVIYLGVLLTHTVLAAAVPFLVIFTLRAAFRDERPRHRRLARWTFPIWLYVSVTGVLIYFTLYHWYR